MSVTTYVRTTEGGELSFLNLLLTHLRDRRRWLYLAFLVGIVAATVVILVTPKTYTARARVMPAVSDGGGLAALAGSMIPSGLLSSSMLTKTAAEANLYLELLKSKTVCDSVLTQPGISPDDGGTLMSQWKPANPEIGRSRIRSMATAAHDRSTGIITLSVTTTEPALSAQIANALIQQLDLRKQQLDRDAARQSSVFLEHQLAGAREQLAAAESLRTEVLANNRNYLGSDDPGLRTEVERAEAEVEFRRQVLLSLMQLKAGSEMEAEKSVPRLTVLEWAETPLFKSGPSIRKTVMMTTLGVMIFAIGLITLQTAYQWYIPNRTRTELADSCGVVGRDVYTILNTIRKPLRVNEESEA
jgi:uncharacterized protein involved in exopolysaccharide biosynthesis